MLFKNNHLHFLLLVVITVIFAYEYNSFIQTDELMAQNLSEKYTQEIIFNYLNLRHQWAWVVYFFIPILIYLPTTIIALTISLVIWLYYLNETNPHVKFSDTWRIVLYAQWSSVAVVFIKLFWFGVIHTHYTMVDLQSFYPLSIINFFDIKELAVWFVYPLQLINVFELAYWAILVVGIKRLLNRSWLKSLGMVLLSYGLALIVWVVVIMFLSLNFS
jgi:hypothetical protein